MIVALPPCSKLAVCMLVSRIMLPATPIRVQAGNISHDVAVKVEMNIIVSETRISSQDIVDIR